MPFMLTLIPIAQSIGSAAVDVPSTAPSIGKLAPGIRQAMAMLTSIGMVPTVPVVAYHPKALLGNPQTSNGFTDGHTIFVNDRIADPIAIAGIIAHEQFHVDHGANTEDGAYVEQLRVLKALHADRKSVRAVEDALQRRR